jgi:hypothetical protein
MWPPCSRACRRSKEGTRCRGCQDRRLPSRVGDDRETRAAPLGRTDFDTVPEQFGCLLHDEEPEAETVRPAVIGSLKRPEDRRQRAGADADTGIAHRDAQFRAAAAARWRRPVSSKHGEQRGRRGRASSSCAATAISPACAWRRASCVGAAHEVLSPAYASIHHEAEVHDLIDAKTLLDACSLPLARPRRQRRQ